MTLESWRLKHGEGFIFLRSNADLESYRSILRARYDWERPGDASKMKLMWDWTHVGRPSCVTHPVTGDELRHKEEWAERHVAVQTSCYAHFLRTASPLFPAASIFLTDCYHQPPRHPYRNIMWDSWSDINVMYMDGQHFRCLWRPGAPGASQQWFMRPDYTVYRGWL